MGLKLCLWFESAA